MVSLLQTGGIVPPSMTNSVPVMDDAGSETRKATRSCDVFRLRQVGDNAPLALSSGPTP
jgi:hypothetical protein